jgi:tRNA A-37 threonylcarbamoyl transferase component Bud32
MSGRNEPGQPAPTTGAGRPPDTAPPADAGRSATSSTVWEGLDPLGASAGCTVPGYEIVGELGRGGMGVVYKARQLKLSRDVALKMILFGEYAGGADRARFRAEAEAVARLDHPGIVRIFDVGEHQGLPYLCLELCPGGSLADKLRGRPLPPRDAARTAEQVARAVHAAHERQVVHRDLKPANVLLGADGRPKVTDFGLAKRTDGAAGPTATGAVVGTPSYMAPEQAGGRAREAGRGTDVYALGAILYELLTGRPPFQAATAADTLLQVLHQDPVAPRELQPGLPRDLETICLKCLEKDPRNRYPTAEALARDLERYLDGRPILARPVSAVGRAAKWARRRPAVAGLLAALAVVTLLSLVGLTHLWLDAAAARREAVGERDAAAAAGAEARAQREAADRERDRAVANLREAERQRERAHAYLESILDLNRFGRSLARRPIRKDFDLRVAVVHGGKEQPKRALAPGDFDPSRPFHLEVTPQDDCHLTVFYALPDAGRPESCLLVYPTRLEKSNRVAGGKTVTVPDDPAATLSPVVSRGEPPFLYVVASERDWRSGVKPDRIYNVFPAFSPKAMDGLAPVVRGVVEGPGAGEKSQRVAEEIFLFNVRADPKAGK